MSDQCLVHSLAANFWTDSSLLMTVVYMIWVPDTAAVVKVWKNQRFE